LVSKIRTALLSVHDKTGLVDFASGLARHGVRLISTGGTARHLSDAGLEVTPLEEVTGQGEMLGGRVKTLQPAVFGGILARREDAKQMDEIANAGIDPIDLVVVNLYPFRSTVAAPGHRLIDALQQTDIGGVSLLRAAYKNFSGVVVVVDPADYAPVLDAIDAGDIELRQRLGWAQKAVEHTASYEAAICNYLGSIDADCVDLESSVDYTEHPDSLALVYRRRATLRYGENPHQLAAIYAESSSAATGLLRAEQLQGKELSFNNYLDADTAWQLAWKLPSPGVAIIKHANPCGAALAATPAEAYCRARATDPTSAFGGIVGLNCQVDAKTAAEIATTFIEVVIAPGFDEEALRSLGSKPDLRLLRAAEPAAELERSLELRQVSGGLLVQRHDTLSAERWAVASQRQPTPEQEADLRFLWGLISSVKSNAIVVGRAGQLLGVGAGQMSRVDSCRIAVWKAVEAGHDVARAAAASAAFFPFADGVEVLAEAGITAIVQPGGSKRDGDVIAAADHLGLVLVHTGTRHFRH
jgi:phosphoribosylaminoimidazolecarboxamide formyltransferase/IMP cyclohydrolase